MENSNIEYLNTKQSQNSNDQKDTRYDLEQGTFVFATRVREFCDRAQKTVISLDDIKQLIRSSGSIGANYIEANEALSKKDFSLRVKICRKEAKETVYWLRLLASNGGLEGQKVALIKEATELMKIFGAIIEKTR